MRVSNEFCQKRLSTLNVRGFLEYTASKFGKVGQFFYPFQSLVSWALGDKNWIHCTKKVLVKEPSTLVFCPAWVPLKWRNTASLTNFSCWSGKEILEPKDMFLVWQNLVIQRPTPLTIHLISLFDFQLAIQSFDVLLKLVKVSISIVKSEDQKRLFLCNAWNDGISLSPEMHCCAIKNLELSHQIIFQYRKV